MVRWLDLEEISFPPTEDALEEPNGLLAASEELGINRLINAYQRGIFPWYSEDQPILWWSPDPRMVITRESLHISRTMRKLINKRAYSVTSDKAFGEVISSCAAPRETQDGTWITEEIIESYKELHHLGYAHSIEVWKEESLVGGLYGIALGKVFFGESMFSRANNASKYGFVTMANRLFEEGYKLIDCQVSSEHMESLGGFDVSRRDFETILSKSQCERPGEWPFSESTL